MKALACICAILALALLSGCSLANQVQPNYLQTGTYVPPPQTYPASFVCQDGNTPVQTAICQNPRLAAQDVQMASIFRQRLGSADLFGRDQLLAFQHAWLLGLPGACGLASPAASVTAPAAVSCLAAAYQSQIAAIDNFPEPTDAISLIPAGGGIGGYVHYKLLDAKASFCADIGGQSAAALSANGTIDPTQLAGAAEIAGSHGTASGPGPQGGNITVDLYRAGLYGGYQMRARNVSAGGTPLLGPDSLGSYVETLPNGGGRYVSMASQTGDYGAIDVFSYQGQVLALIADTIGYNSPAPPGEAAVAGIFTLSQGTAAPACLFETYVMPPPIAMGVFGSQPSLTPFLALVSSIQGAPADALAASDRQDASYFASEADWLLFNMPLVVVAQANAGNWVGWLRHRHDAVLDALFAWSQKSQQNQAKFNQLFSLLRPAVTDLDAVYVQQQGLTVAQAEQATALAVMELLYQTTINFNPGLDSGPADPDSYGNYHPRYPILANPQS